MTDTEKAALERRIDELCQENERLRADQAHWELGNCPSCPNIADLQEALEQNAKLRELVRTFYHCTTSGECDECPINDGGPVHLMPDTICDTIHDRMRELGVDA